MLLPVDLTGNRGQNHEQEEMYENCKMNSFGRREVTLTVKLFPQNLDKRAHW